MEKFNHKELLLKYNPECVFLKSNDPDDYHGVHVVLNEEPDVSDRGVLTLTTLPDDKIAVVSERLHFYGKHSCSHILQICCPETGEVFYRKEIHRGGPTSAPIISPLSDGRIAYVYKGDTSFEIINPKFQQYSEISTKAIKK